MPQSELTDRALAILADLVAFDTTSRNSNLALIGYAEAYLQGFGASLVRLASHDGDKANLLARIGPDAAGGVVLSGHTDVVPVDGQEWSTPPFVLTRRDGRLYGRGAADMKSFIAVALAAAPAFARTGLARPVYFALSYDEEVGCLGAPALVRALADLPARPAAVVVGEPSEMRIIGAHKGVSTFKVVVTGQEAHSSLPHQGVSANMAAISLLGRLSAIASDLERRAQGRDFDPPWSTLTIGKIAGGTAGNILARECSFEFDLRTVPGDTAEGVLAPFFAEVERVDADIRRRAGAGGVAVTRQAAAPALRPEAGGDAERLVRSLTGDNGPHGAVSYGAEAGQFQEAGLSTVICGPGSIEQAHKPDEFIDLDQVALCAAFMERLAARLAGPA